METIKKPHGFTHEKMFIVSRDLLNQADKTLLNDLFITDLGYFPNAKYHYRARPEGSEQYILIVNIKGRGYVVMDQNRYEIRENMLVLIPKDLPHEYGAYSDDPWDIYWVHFNGAKAPYYFKSESEIIKPLGVTTVAKILPLFSIMIETLEIGMTADNILHASIVLGSLLSTLFIFTDLYQETRDKKTDHFITVMNYLNSHLHEDISLEDIAGVVHLSKSQLNLIFREKTGSSPVDFLIRLKIQESCRLLNLTDLQINEIALKVGYSDPYYFSRIFKKIMGMSPLQYRKNQVT